MMLGEMGKQSNSIAGGLVVAGKNTALSMQHWNVPSAASMVPT